MAAECDTHVPLHHGSEVFADLLHGRLLVVLLARELSPVRAVELLVVVVSELELAEALVGVLGQNGSDLGSNDRAGARDIKQLGRRVAVEPVLKLSELLRIGPRVG